jgi:hypothetical protein
MDQRAISFMKIHFVGKSLWFMQNNNGVKQRFLDCFLKILDKKTARTTPRLVNN